MMERMESMCDNDCPCNDGCGCNDNCGCNEPVTMKACILRVCCCELLVCDLCTSQEVRVHTDKACCFQVGQRVCIEYNGAMTMSIPPQISAICVKPLNNCGCNCCC